MTDDELEAQRERLVEWLNEATLAKAVVFEQLKQQLPSPDNDSAAVAWLELHGEEARRMGIVASFWRHVAHPLVLEKIVAEPLPCS